ncbi:RNA polymerase sigma factor [Streptomyces sp. NPDC021212]|uniref:RNA polymerase sigma factor n=1 Tax=Streptomyces sp. NPDC021212 TaxID=3365118 RepID=UPI0037AB42F2
MAGDHEARAGRKVGARRAASHHRAAGDAAADDDAGDHPGHGHVGHPDPSDRPVLPAIREPGGPCVWGVSATGAGALSDQELTRRLREEYASGATSPASGDLLYRRHHQATLSYARTCCRALHDAEDLASEAFIRTFQAVRAGGGPRGPWRPYLLTVVRHTALEWSEGERQILLTADFESWRQHAPTADPQWHLVAREDRQLLIRSFRRLPERWRIVLWHTLVEEESPRRVASLLGISPSGVTSLAFRAREGLRESYLQSHLESAANARCRHFSGMIGASVRRGGVRGHTLARHLAECAFCAHAYKELLGLNAAMRRANHTANPTAAPPIR